MSDQETAERIADAVAGEEPGWARQHIANRPNGNTAKLVRLVTAALAGARADGPEIDAVVQPLATATTVIHPDDGDGPWVSLARIAVPRGVPGRRARVVVLPDGDG